MPHAGGVLGAPASARAWSAERVEQLEQLGRALGDRRRAGGATVASSPRAIGPVSARAAPSRAQLSTLARTSGDERLARDAGGRRERARRRPRARRGSSRRSTRPRGRRRGPRRRSSNGSMPRRRAPAPGERAGARRWCRRPRSRRRRSGAVRRHVISGCRPKRLMAGRATSSAGRARAVPDERARARSRRRRRRSRASGTHSSTTSAPAPSAPRPCGPSTWWPALAQRAGEGAAEPAGADDGDARWSSRSSSPGIPVAVAGSSTPQDVSVEVRPAKVTARHGTVSPPRRPHRYRAGSIAPDGRRPDTAEDRREALKEVYREARVCTRCPQLAQTRTQVVFGAGNADADLLFVGEAPGATRIARACRSSARRASC